MTSIPYPPSGIIREVTFEADTSRHFCTTNSTNTNGTREEHYLLTKGTGERESPGSNRLERQQLDSHFGAREILGTETDAIAYFLTALENAQYSEREAYNLLKDSGLDTQSYQSFLNEFTKKDRGRRLINDSKERATYLEHPLDRCILSPPEELDYEPTWRSTNPSKDAIDIASNLIERVDTTRSCYLTTFEALHHIDHDRVTYCEGLAMGKHPGRGSTHAWLEIDNEVVELFWPWSGPEPPETAVYFGDRIDLGTVYERYRGRPTACSVLLPDDIYYQMPAVKRAMADAHSMMTQDGVP